MVVLSWIGFSAGVVVVLGTTASVIATLVVPRGLRSRLANLVTTGVSAMFRALAARRSRYEDRDTLLSLEGPVVLMGLVAVWIGGIYLGFTLLLWPFTGAELGTAATVAGSSMFTLGFATVPGPAPTALTFLSAGFGLVVVALQIAYLPTLYNAFNRREQLVTMLESRGGVPAWGPEILARHELIDNVASLGNLYARWEEWAADLAESHTTYQVLILFRSPHPLRSWITALLSVLDAGALQLSLNPLTAPAEARPFMRMGYMALREVATVMRIPFNADPHPDDPVSLTREEFDDAVEQLTSAGWRPERDLEEAWVQFRGWRVTYEQLAWTIADRVDAPPALWSGPRHTFGVSRLAPARPPHRSPSVEQQQVRAITEARREARPAISLSGRRRDPRSFSAAFSDGIGGAAAPARDAMRADRAEEADAAAQQPVD
ncbi:MAG TPA: hypothetical protein VN193_07885 [Candidatus Angelobacter sp.]|nr:hypothetical protein [Candidatus Angelobacter sp.]